MKTILLIISLSCFTVLSNAQVYNYCNFNIAASGNLVTCSHIIDVVHFQQITSSQITWGDGAVSPGINNYGTHYYCANGTYTITVEVWVLGAYACTFSQAVTVANAMTASSTISYTQNNNTVDFTTYTNFPGIISNSSHTWYFGDGNFSGGSNMISYTYTANGTYYPYVTHAFNDLNTGCPFTTTTPVDTVIISNIPVPPGPCVIHADYSANNNGLDVIFTNLTTCPDCINITYEWMFGDGGAMSNLTNPAHTYMTAGNYFVCVSAMGIDSNQNGCSDTKCDYLTVTAPNNVIDIEKGAITIYPNPASDNIYIKAASRQEKELYNSFGQLLFTTNENEINTSKLSKGIYFLKIGNLAKRIIIE